MRKILIPVLAGVAAIAVIWAIGLRIFVVQPIGALPEGKTIIFVGAHGLRFVDSPDAMCMRRVGSVSLICRAMAVKTAMDDGKIVMRLPFSSALYWMSGAPEVDR